MSEGLAVKRNQSRKYYEHAARPEWGVAVLTWEGEGKRGYRFEDGKLRIFKKGFFHMLREAEADRSQREALAAYARRRLPERRVSAAVHDTETITLADQIEYFRSCFPQGFAGEEWRREHRTRATRPLQRHREPAIDLARSKLAAARLDQWIADGEPDRAIAVLRDVMAKTDLVSAGQRRELANLQPWQVRRLAGALRDLLWGEEEIRHRLGRWIAALSAAASSRTTTWALATAPLALVHPDHHVCVRYSSFNAQGRIMVPPYDPGRVANVSEYESALAVARRVRDRLREEGLQPADMLDVYDFMWLTLRPKARKAIAARRSAERGRVSAVESGNASEDRDGDRAAA